MKKPVLICIVIFVSVFLNAQNIVESKIKFDYETHQGTLDVIFDIPSGFHQNYSAEYFSVDVRKIDGIAWSGIRYPAGKIENGIRNFYGKTVLKIPFTVEKSVKKKKYEIFFTAKYQLCNEKNICFLPREESMTAVFEVDENPGYVLMLLRYFLFAFLGGLILNLMPCVFPVLSIKALSLVKQSDQKKEEILLNSLAYTVGVLFSFLVLALVVVFIKRSGELVGWGFQFQNPIFIMALTGIVFVFALSLFDVFVFSFPGINKISKVAGKEGLAGSFFKGLLAVVLATPCTAPLLGTALGFAFAQPYYLVITVFLLVGLGLSLPFLLLGIFPVLIKILPKPGEWLNVFKEIMGLLLVGTGIWLLSVLQNMIGNEMRSFLIFLGILGLSYWFYGRFARPEYNIILRWIVIAVSLSAITAGGYFFLVNKKPVQQVENVMDKNTSHASINGWEKFSEEKLNGYILQGKPVFIDFFAEWCLTCKVNESTVLLTEDMQDQFRKYGVKLLYADYTKNDPLVSKWLVKYERAGVPLYVLYSPSNKKPVILPEILTKTLMADYLKRNIR
jgi:thiol:disulfide interchange protein